VNLLAISETVPAMGLTPEEKLTALKVRDHQSDELIGYDYQHGRTAQTQDRRNPTEEHIGTGIHAVQSERDPKEPIKEREVHQRGVEIEQDASNQAGCREQETKRRTTEAY
jgi:hypothetical protein